MRIIANGQRYIHEVVGMEEDDVPILKYDNNSRHQIDVEISTAILVGNNSKKKLFILMSLTDIEEVKNDRERN